MLVSHSCLTNQTMLVSYSVLHVSVGLIYEQFYNSEKKRNHMKKYDVSLNKVTLINSVIYKLSYYYIRINLSCSHMTREISHTRTMDEVTCDVLLLSVNTKAKKYWRICDMDLLVTSMAQLYNL